MWNAYNYKHLQIDQVFLPNWMLITYPYSKSDCVLPEMLIIYQLLNLFRGKKCLCLLTNDKMMDFYFSVWTVMNNQNKFACLGILVLDFLLLPFSIPLSLPFRLLFAVSDTFIS